MRCNGRPGGITKWHGPDLPGMFRMLVTEHDVLSLRMDTGLPDYMNAVGNH